DILHHLPAQHHRLLPTLAGVPRIYEFARELVACSDNAIVESTVETAVRAYQSEQAFTIAELWILPLMLRLVLVEALSRYADDVVEAQYFREAGYLWANRLAAAIDQGPEPFDAMMAALARTPLISQVAFVASLNEQLQSEEHILAPVHRWLE